MRSGQSIVQQYSDPSNDRGVFAACGQRFAPPTLLHRLLPALPVQLSVVMGEKESAPATLAEKVVLSTVSAASAKFTAPPVEWAWLALNAELVMDTIAPELLSMAPPRVAALKLNCECTICRRHRRVSTFAHLGCVLGKSDW